jgi:CspA family cold shock protein
MTIIARGAGLTPPCDAHGAGRVGADSFEYGTVRWVDPARGFGFLGRDGDKAEVYIHLKALPRGAVLREGDRVRFVLQRMPDGRFRAASATVVGAGG